MHRDFKTGLILGVAALIVIVVIWSQYTESENRVLIQPPAATGIPPSAYVGDPVAPEPVRATPTTATAPEAIIAAVPTPVDPPPTTVRTTTPVAATAVTPAATPPAGAAATPPAAPAAQPANARYHITKEGERLWTLAEKYYGQGKGYRWTMIRDANKDIIPDSGLLKPDLKLVIPPDGAQPATLLVSPTTTPKAASPKPRQERTHVVAKGDTLSNLAEKYYGDKRLWVRIRKANESLLPDPDRLPLGVELVIPPKSCPPRPSNATCREPAPGPARPSPGLFPRLPPSLRDHSSY